MKGIFEGISRGSLGSRPNGQSLKQTRARTAMMAGTVNVKAVAVWPCESTFIVASNVVLTFMIAGVVMYQSPIPITRNTLMETRDIRIVRSRV